MRSMIFGLLALLAVLDSSPARAEEIHYGVVGGVNFAHLYISPRISGVGTEPFFVGGGFANIPLTEMFFFEPQLRYNKKGATVTTYAGGVYTRTTLALQYVEAPLYFMFKAAPSNFRMNFFIGPNIGIKVGDSFTATNLNTGASATASNILGSNVKGYDLALDLGLGGEFHLPGELMGRLSLAYSMGFVNLDSTKGNVVKSSGIQVMAGVGY